MLSICGSSLSIVAPDGRVSHMSHERYSEPNQTLYLQRPTASNNSRAGDTGVRLAPRNVGP